VAGNDVDTFGWSWSVVKNRGNIVWHNHLDLWSCISSIFVIVANNVDGRCPPPLTHIFHEHRAFTISANWPEIE
jgi:hypothetical protein